MIEINEYINFLEISFFVLVGIMLSVKIIHTLEKDEYITNTLIIMAGIISILVEIIYVLVLDIWDWIKKYIGGYYGN